MDWKLPPVIHFPYGKGCSKYGGVE